MSDCKVDDDGGISYMMTLEAMQEELIAKTIEQQETKVRVYYELKRKGLQIPSALRLEVEDLLGRSND
jgi:hypothetical protein